MCPLNLSYINVSTLNRSSKSDWAEEDVLDVNGTLKITTVY